MAFSVVVLAGGRSRRFGCDKLELEWHGRVLRDHVVERARELSQDVVVLVAPDGRSDAPLGTMGVRYVCDPEPWPGPLVAVAAALDHLANDVAVVVAADMPNVPLPILTLLASRVAESHAPVAGLEMDGMVQQLPVALRVSATAQQLARAVGAGERRLGAVARLDGALAIPEPEWRALDPDGASLRDIDTQTDLQQALEQYSVA